MEGLALSGDSRQVARPCIAGLPLMKREIHLPPVPNAFAWFPPTEDTFAAITLHFRPPKKKQPELEDPNSGYQVAFDL